LNSTGHRPRFHLKIEVTLPNFNQQQEHLRQMGIVSGVLYALTITQPAFLIGVAVYGILDAGRVFDHLEEFWGIDDTVLWKW
jgi:hypothetical protein